jgi:Gpi18-like mannosyltransferase
MGIVIREVFSFWTGHPSDFELWVRLGYAMMNGGDPYGSLPPVPGLSFPSPFALNNAPTIAYLPLWPLITGFVYFVYSIVGFGNRFAYYFLLKQPVIAGDVILAYLLYSFVKARNARDPTWALRFWALCPFTIIISGIWGMFDSIAMTFVLLCLGSSREIERGVWAGLATFAKSIPVIFAIPLIIANRKGIAGLLAALALPTFTSLLVFVVMRWPLPTVFGTLASTLEKGGETMSWWDSFYYCTYLRILPSLTPQVYGILGIFWIPALAFMTTVAAKKFGFKSDYALVQSLLVVTLTFLLFKARVTEQYAIYLLALSVIDVGLWHPERKPLLLLSTVTALAFLISNNFFLIRFLSPVDAQALVIEAQLSQLIGPIRSAVNFILGTAFSVLNATYLTRLLANNRTQRIKVSAQERNLV